MDPFFLQVVFLQLIFLKAAQTLVNQTISSSSSSVSAIYVFGDSLVDAGNNNYINTYAKCNFSPYGVDFINNVSTGRFSNGKVIPDFIASYLGIKEIVPPYLDPTLSMTELITGVSFASGGSGFDPLTSLITLSIPVEKQLENFEEYKTRLESTMGVDKARTHVQNAVFILCAGQNDIGVTYLTIPDVRQKYTVEEYEAFVLHNLKTFVQGLWQSGARRIGVFGLLALGATPAAITVRIGFSNYYTMVAKDYNEKLQKELAIMQKTLMGSRIGYGDLYTPLLDMVQSPDKFGFEETTTACCGTGRIEVSILCNRLTPICPDRSNYVFWGSVHPTQKAAFILSAANFQKLIDFLVAA